MWRSHRNLLCQQLVSLGGQFLHLSGVFFTGLLYLRNLCLSCIDFRLQFPPGPFRRHDPVDGGKDGVGLLEIVRQSVLQIIGHDAWIVGRVLLIQDRFCYGEQRSAHLGVPVDGHHGGHHLIQLAAQRRHLLVGIPQLLLHPGDLPFQLRNLLVQFLDAVPQLLGDAGLLAVQLRLAAVELALGLVQLRFAAVQLPLGLVQLPLGVRQPVTDLHQQLVVDLIDFFLIQRDFHGFFHQTGGGHAGNAAHALDGGDDLVLHILGQLVDVHALVVHRHVLGGHHVHAHLHDGGGAGHVGQGVCQLVDLGAHLDHGGVHVGVLGEFQHDHAVILVAGAGDVLHAVDGAQRRLQRPGDLVLHLLGACTGVGGDDHQVGQAHGGQQVGLHFAQTHKAQHQNEHHPHQHGKGLFDTEF